MMFVYVGYDVTNCTSLNIVYNQSNLLLQNVLRSVVNDMFVFRQSGKCDKVW
jgi:hypothetical protein